MFIKETEIGKAHSGELAFPRDLALKLMRNKGFVFASIASATSFFLMSGIRQDILPIYAAEVAGLSPADIGMILSAATLANLFLTIPIGYGIDLIGRKPIIVFGLVVSSVSMLLFPQFTSFILLCGASLIMGIGTSGMQQAPLAMATDATIGEPRGISMGIFRFFGDIGSLFGPILLGVIADGFGLSAPFYVMSGVILLVAVFIFLFGEETLPGKNGKKNLEQTKTPL
jgi:MFS family permease